MCVCVYVCVLLKCTSCCIRIWAEVSTLIIVSNMFPHILNRDILLLIQNLLKGKQNLILQLLAHHPPSVSERMLEDDQSEEERVYHWPDTITVPWGSLLNGVPRREKERENLRKNGRLTRVRKSISPTLLLANLQKFRGIPPCCSCNRMR